MENLATIFAALGDPIRLAIVERVLEEGESTVGEIAERFPVSLPAVSRHISVLERAGILERRVDRQWRVCRLQPAALARVEEWVGRHRAAWSGAPGGPLTGPAH